MTAAGQAYTEDTTALRTLEQATGVVLSMVNVQGPPVLTPLAGGRNNRVYRVDVPKGSLVLKSYFHHEADPRDRLEVEFTFLKQLWALGIRCMPQPIARLPLRHLGLYGFVKGSSLQAGQVTAEHVQQAAAFVRTINQHRDAWSGASAEDASMIVEDRPVFMEASDACFSLTEHLTSIERRLSALLGAPAADEVDRQMLGFVEESLIPAWRVATGRFRQQVIAGKASLHEPVPAVDRVLSPSDFGFHNALVKEDGCVVFLDFEYAGWDDPAKLICDFFTQVAVPVPAEHQGVFVQEVAAVLHDPKAAAQRVRWLLPLYRLKWCAMALNVFLPVSAERQRHARPGEDVTHRKASQLQQARDLLAAHQAQVVVEG